MNNSQSRDEITAIVVLGGKPPTRAIKQFIPDHQLVIAADSGLHGAIELGLRVNVVIGDMDSVDKALLAAVEVNGATIITFPHDKDQTDAELALMKAIELGASTIVLITKGGGRLDHELGVFAVVQNPAFRHCTIKALWDNGILHMLRGPSSVTISGKTGSIVGLIAVGGTASGISTTGLQWALNNESLAPYSSRGVSNIMLGVSATISLEEGALFVVQSSALDH